MADNGLREVEWTDIPALAQLERVLFAGDAWAEASWWGELANRPRREYTVAVDEVGGIVGYAGLDHGGAVADIMTIATAPGAQGRGLGRALLDWLVERARAEGAESLMLEVRADNERAVDLYERNGFECISVRRRYYRPGDIDALIMRKLLEVKTARD